MKLKILFKVATLLLLISSTLLLTACPTDSITFAVKFDSNGGTAVRTYEVYDGDKMKAPQEPEKLGYTFIGWYNEEALWNFESDTVNKNITLVAKWSLNTYTAKFYDGDVLVETKTFTIEDGTELIPPELPKNDDVLGYGYKWDDLTIKPQNLTVNLIYTQILTYEEYQNMTLEQKQTWYRSFDTAEDFFNWGNAVKKKYENEQDRFIVYIYNDKQIEL